MHSTRFRSGLVLLAGLFALLGCNSKIHPIHGPGGTVNSLGAPTNLTGVLSGGTVDLAWTRNSTAEVNMRVDIATQPILSLSDVSSAVLLPAGSTSYNYSVPSIGPTYYFRVLAVTTTLESDPSNVCGVQTVTAPPATPPGLAAVGISSSQILVTWVDVGGAQSYLIERSPNLGGTWLALPTVSQGIQSDTDGGLSANTVYSYRITATNQAGSSAPSAMVSAQTLCGSQTSTTVYSGTNAGFYTDLALSGATEYISHYDASHTEVLVTAGGTTVLADSGPSSGSVVGSDGTSIALNGSVIQTVEHHTTTNGTALNKLRSATSGAGTLSFSSGVADPNSYPSGGFPKVRINPFPTPNGMMIYTAVFSGFTTLVYANGTYNSVDTTSCTSYSGTSLSYDPLGNFHVAYTRTAAGSTGTQLLYGVKGSGSISFGITALTSTGNPTDVSIVGYENSFNQGVAHIAYYESTGKRLMHAWRPDLLVSTPWMFEVIDSTTSADVGAYCSITMDPGTGRLHVSYYDRVNGDLRYARKDGSGPWSLFLIDARGNVGTYTSIAVDGSGTVHIAYRDETNQALKVARGTP